ncbi:MAG: BON domain-containing protein [Betaproteobacteria bacterium]|nr:BON domain-containing protein [Betaproteobacteria bacterium]
MRSPMKIAALFVVAASTLVLQGCFTLAATGIGATVMLVDDRRSAGIYIEDENIEWKARARLIDRFNDAHVNVTSFNLSVLLTGEVPSEQMKKDIEQAVRGIPSVKNVTNELAVAGNASLAARSSDSLTTTNTKARFISNGKFSANHVKVVTEASTVFLMGIVTRDEGDAAAELARTTSGVARVVKVFEYIESAPKK